MLERRPSRLILAIVVLLGLALVVCLSFLWGPRASRGDDELAVDPEVTPLRGEGPATVTTGSAAERPNEARTRVGETAVPAAAMAPYEFEMEIVARTVDDLPGASVPIRLAPEFHVLNRTQTDDQGVARVRWRGRAPETTMVYGSPRGLSGSGRLRRCVVRAGVPSRVAVRVRADSSSAASFVVHDSSGLIKLRGVRLSGGTFRIAGLGSLGSLPALHRDKEGWSWFTTGRGHVRNDDSPRQVVLRYQKAFESGVLVDLSVVAPQADSGPRRKRTLSGTVRDAAGRPVAGALVLLGDKRVRTDKSGAYEIGFEARDRQRLSARAGGGDHGLAQHVLETGAADDLFWDPQLDRGTELRGQLVTPDGKPCAGWRIEIQPEDSSPWIDGTKTDQSGRFAIPNVVDRAYHLRAFAPECVLPSFQRRDVRPVGDQVFAVFDVGERGFFHVMPRSRDGGRLSDTEVRLWDDRSGEGRRFRPSDRKQSVVAARYRVVMGAPGFALQDHTEVRITAGQLTDLGDITLGDRANLDLAPAKKGLSLYRMHAAVPSRVETAGKNMVLLPPGSYRAFDGDDEFEFVVKPGDNDVPDPIRRDR